ncbi:phage tail sheath subtilisin-like domain-containing protein [Nonomuraea soli]|uniref:Uncharacterized protein n=1 Tax=Nonomuraea soli TaxID=1032476 RepID=A0A7W0HPR7_9ACTN|nr:phage tail sheath subtilisin-like domain-containing protein [Nonomuraea soli]MBA2891037.1 hypothetical protein [Nonomuraea soli]
MERIAALVGFAAGGPFDTAVMVTGWGGFVQVFGDFSAGCHLAHAVYGYFLNGGSSCYVVRVGSEDAARALDAAPEAETVAAPDLARMRGAQEAIAAHCAATGRTALLDPPRGLPPARLGQWRAGLDSERVRVCYPWISVLDPASGTGRSMPSSGHVAGVMARSGALRPGAAVRGAISVEHRVGPAEQERLAAEGVICLGPLPGRGIRITNPPATPAPARNDGAPRPAPAGRRGAGSPR